MTRELLLGCGNRSIKQVQIPGREDWTNLTRLDINPACKPDVLWDLEKLPYPFEDDTFDEIHCYHCLEHIGRQGDYKFFFAQFTELHRITKPEGYFCGVVPAWGTKWVWGDPSHTRVIQLETLTFLDQRNYRNVGLSTMSDFREIYKVSWELQHHEMPLLPDGQPSEEFVFVLKAVKE